MSEAIREFFAGKTVGILGYGREGKSTHAFLRRHFPEMPIVIADKVPLNISDSNVRLLCGENYLDILKQCDICIKTPGVPLRGVLIPATVHITCQTDLFLRFADCVTIGVTGSKGKTTTTTLIYLMLKASGAEALLMGNMGLPVLDCLEEATGKTACIEMSSHQLQFTAKSPHIAVWTNLYEEHLDHYDGGFIGYAAAKANICLHQTAQDYFISNASQDLQALTDISGCKANRITVSPNENKRNAFLDTLYGLSPRLKGEHNRQDIYYAATAALLAGATEDGIRQALRDFEGIPHRMDLLGTYAGIRWVDDCITTIPEGVLLTVDALEDVDTLIIGGQDRGLDYHTFAKGLASRPLRNLVCLPDTGYAIADLPALRESGKTIIRCDTMIDAIATSLAHTAPGKICLLSPAAASYNRYKNFEEKGAHFKACIEELTDA